MSTNTPQLLTLTEVAATLRVSKTSVYRLVEARLLPFHRVGRSLRFRRSDVLAYLDSTRVEATSRPKK